MTRVIIFLLLVSATANAAEIYAGHSTQGMSRPTTDSITGVLVGDSLKAGFGKLGAAHYAHVIAEASHKAVFYGVGVGLVEDHPRLDGRRQFTLTAGARWGGFVLRWLHFSNGADIFKNSDKAARARNLGIDFLTLGFEY